jgi:hypothetical protein
VTVVTTHLGLNVLFFLCFTREDNEAIVKLHVPPAVAMEAGVPAFRATVVRRWWWFCYIQAYRIHPEMSEQV